MSNPIQSIIALVKKGDKKTLLIGAGVIGGGIGLFEFLKNRHSVNSAIASNDQSALAAGADTSGAGGGGGGAASGLDPGLLGGSDSNPGAAGTSADPTAGGGFSLPGLPSLTPLPDTSGFGSLPGLSPSPDNSGLSALPSFSPPPLSALPTFNMPQLPDLSGANAGNYGSLPSLPPLSDAYSNFANSGTNQLPSYNPYSGAASDQVAAQNYAARNQVSPQLLAQVQSGVGGAASAAQNYAAIAQAALPGLQAQYQASLKLPQTAAQTLATGQLQSAANQAAQITQNALNLFPAQQAQNQLAAIAGLNAYNARQKAEDQAQQAGQLALQNALAAQRAQQAGQINYAVSMNTLAYTNAVQSVGLANFLAAQAATQQRAQQAQTQYQQALSLSVQNASSAINSFANYTPTIQAAPLALTPGIIQTGNASFASASNIASNAANLFNKTPAPAITGGGGGRPALKTAN